MISTAVDVWLSPCIPLLHLLTTQEQEGRPDCNAQPEHAFLQKSLLCFGGAFCMHAGLMQKSKIGEGNVESGAVSVNERRTSSTVLLDSTVVEQHPQLQPMVLQLQSKAQKLLDVGM